MKNASIAATVALAWLALPAAAAGGTSTGEAADGAACVSSETVPADMTAFVQDAVAVVEQTGYDPADYRLEIRRDDPLGSQPTISAVFVPDPSGRLHALRVDRSAPCAPAWIWSAGRFTAWQREVIERAREMAVRLERDLDASSNVHVVESRQFVSVHVTTPGELPETRFLIDKQDLSRETRGGRHATPTRPPQPASAPDPLAPVGTRAPGG